MSAKVSTAGIGLVGVGVLWEHLRGPSPLGWAAIAAGFLLLLLSRRRPPVRTPLDGPLLLLALQGKRHGDAALREPQAGDVEVGEVPSQGAQLDVGELI